MSSKPTVLITGAAGGLAGISVGDLVGDYNLVGVDPRPLPKGKDFPGEFHVVDYQHRRMSEVFRSRKIDILLHLGRIPVGGRLRSSDRYNTNVLGTRNLLQLAKRHEVSQVVVLSTFHVYGAHPHNPGHLLEDDPLRASQTFPELRDSIEMDNLARMFMLQNRSIRVVLLRPVHVVGATIQNYISQLLRSELCPVLAGYDPLLQFIHESDLARAIRLSIESKKSGVYNVAGEGVISYKKAVSVAGARAVPLPAFLVYSALGTLSRLRLGFPKHLVDFFRYSAIVSDDSFRREHDYQPQVSTIDALRSLRSLRAVVEPPHTAR
ncbi:NAD-dependent epimerase/dehydratase family protein [bacterium]|nr:NAD-dependent epimerase/dehydratase family protein [bacterium]